jgi:hypothetical protein
MVQCTRFCPWVGRTLCTDRNIPSQAWRSLTSFFFLVMSAPTRQFHRLSIGQDMPDSTALPARGRPGPSDDSEGEGSSVESSSEEEGEEEEESSDEEESEPASVSVLAPSGITYDLSQLDSESEARAFVGLTGSFDVVNCRSTSAGYDFQLLDRPQVHIGSDSSTCTCSVFRGHPEGACQHIFVSTLVGEGVRRKAGPHA